MRKRIISLVIAATWMPAAISASNSAAGLHPPAATLPGTRQPEKAPAAITRAIADLASARWRTRHKAQQFLLLHGRRYLPLLIRSLKHAASQE